MAHLPAGPRLSLAVDVNGGARNGQPLRVGVDFVSDQIGHGDLAMTNRLSERPAGDGTDMLLELRDRGAVKRPVAGIMHPWRDLVDQDPAGGTIRKHEHLDREHAHIIEGVGYPLRDVARLGRDCFGDRGRRARDLQNVVAVLVLGDVEAFDLTVGGARHDNRDLALERDESLENCGSGAELFPDAVRIVAGANDRLTLAVIAEATGLEHCWQAYASDGRAQ